jgi:hypothetical protein
VDFFSNIAAQKMVGPQFASMRKEMLEASLVYYQGFLDERKNDATTGEALAAARSHVSGILSELAAHSDVGRTAWGPPLLGEPSVQQALHMSFEQISRLGTLKGLDRWSIFNQLKDADALAPEEGRAKLAALAAQIEDGLKNVINRDQYVRLQQIARQVRGPASFSDPDVEEALGLTPEQKDKIRAIQSRLPGFMMADLPPGGPGGNRPPPGDDHGPPPDFGPRSDRGPTTDQSFKIGPTTMPGNVGRGNRRDVKQEAVADILALLTDEQRETWNALTGEPFTGSVFRGGRGRGGRGGFGPS